MTHDGPLTILCVATYEKGAEFLRECKRQGCTVLLLTTEALRDIPSWPREAIDEIFAIPAIIGREDLLKGVSHVARSRRIDRIVPLDDFDVETAALLREHLRLPGMGETTARYFRDKLAMRVRAHEHGVLVPSFVGLFNDDDVNAYLDRVDGPWLVKPRSQAAAIGIRKATTRDDVWQHIHDLGDMRAFSLLEQFVPGDIFHVDSIVWNRQVVFSAIHRYGSPPWTVAHQGGVFTTSTVLRESEDAQVLDALNRRLLDTLGLVRGVTHTEFIRAHEDGRCYFLETASRVGGAFIVDVIVASTGLNLWHEWAKVEVAGEHGQYEVPPHREDYAGLVLSLARQERPDTSAYDAPEIAQRIDMPYHAGLIVRSDRASRVQELLESYAGRFVEDFYTSAPAPDCASH
ncbi:argininosuccinate lyase [Luteitalea pratensis]|uniref:Argininosuccinate lyase n=1 Tax=Luteitalea pratensis TaxID=1855912 RepID=A0A143PHZ1_LUTPR|nr:ATPase [Luteitalea pratensis]AMY07389.1 argininosuccinate lyase [Luteitalea pratensis]